MVYAYWPWGSHAPVLRKKKAGKKALLITSSAAPALLGRFTYATLRQLKMTSKTIGAKSVGSVFVGLMSNQKHPVLPNRAKKRLRSLAAKLT